MSDNNVLLHSEIQSLSIEQALFALRDALLDDVEQLSDVPKIKLTRMQLQNFVTAHRDVINGDVVRAFKAAHNKKLADVRIARLAERQVYKEVPLTRSATRMPIASSASSRAPLSDDINRRTALPSLRDIVDSLPLRERLRLLLRAADEKLLADAVSAASHE